MFSYLMISKFPFLSIPQHQDLQLSYSLHSNLIPSTLIDSQVIILISVSSHSVLNPDCDSDSNPDPESDSGFCFWRIHNSRHLPDIRSPHGVGIQGRRRSTAMSSISAVVSYHGRVSAFAHFLMGWSAAGCGCWAREESELHRVRGG